MSSARSAVALLLALFALGATLSPPAGAGPPPPPGRPDVVYILADDLDLLTFHAIPEFRPLLQDAGTEFSNAFVSLALCCPSRAAILRGQYAHNNGIYWNKGRNGGYPRFVSTGDEASTLAVWLRAAGYQTALMGKYLNGYPDEDAPTAIPPGWSEWVSPVAGNPYGQLGYTLNVNGRRVRHGRGEADFLEDVLAARAAEWIRARVVAHEPYFLYLAPYAPHGPATAAPRHENAYGDAIYPRSPAFDEEDVRDKPPWVQARERLDSAAVAGADTRFRARLRSTRALVDTLTTLIQTLEELGTLDRTWIVFTSDNGFHIGEHRQRPGKNTGYDTDLRVPFVVRGPGVARGVVDPRLVVNIDHAPTVAELAGVATPGWVDGRSLVPLLRGAAEVPWRSGFLLEHRGPGDADEARPAVPEPEDPADVLDADEDRRGGVPVFTGVHTTRWVYLEYTGGERELYDLAADPHQLENLAGTAPPALVGDLAGWLAALRRCAGSDCRVADVGPPGAW